MAEPLAQPQALEQARRPRPPFARLRTGIDGRHFHILHRVEIGQQLVALEDEAEMLAPQRRQLVRFEPADVPPAKR